MAQVTLNQNSIYAKQQWASSPVRSAVIPQMPGGKKVTSPSFGEAPVSQAASVVSAKPNIRTQFATKEEQDKYLAVSSVLDSQGKKSLNLLLRSGILLSDKSNNKSTTLDNLYKMASTQRVQGITPQMALAETVNTLANPFIITQKFGNIPKPYAGDIVQKAQANPKNPNDKVTPESINVDHSSACVSASIEFNLATQMPAEFARFAEGLTSPKMAVDKTIELKNLTDTTLDSIWLLNTFEVPYQMSDYEKAKLTLAPDKNAYLRAQIQNNDKDKSERSLIDVLMQSTFMNVGSQQTYNSLTDNRSGKFNADNKGLIEFEKTFTESIVQDKNKISVTYQIMDEAGKVTGHTADEATIVKQIEDSLKIGENVIIGYTYTIKNKELPTPDPNKKPDDEIVSGHEITVIGMGKDKSGKLLFICNDTDDDNPNPVIYPAEFIVPKIHHAGLPQQIVAKDTQFLESWKEGLNAYNETKKQTNAQAKEQVK